MNRLIAGHPYRFAFLVYLVLWAIAFACGAALPALSLERRAVVFQVLATLFAAGLLSALGWWRKVGFERPRDLRLVWPPVLCLVAAPLLGGVDLPSPAALAGLVLGVSVTAWSEEVLFRGIVWRALLPTGVMRAVVLSAALFGTLHLAKIAIGGSPAEALPTAIATTLGGVGYAALRLRTGSLWPIMFFHAAFNFVSEIATPEAVPGLVLFLTVAVTLGFVGYGLVLTRRYWRARAAADEEYAACGLGGPFGA